MKQWFEKWFGSPAEAAHLKAGRRGEQQAVRFLKARKFKIRGQRVRAGKHDEIDIIAVHNGVTVFIEVKTRKNEQYGRPFSAVNKAKRKRLSRAAVAYLKRNKLKPDLIRFDVVEVIGETGRKASEIRHIENAFPLDSAYRLWW
jgi:putative endonuclease